MTGAQYADKLRRGRRTAALSVLQPWTDCLLTGAKTPENRTWQTSFRGPLLLHAGLGYDGLVGEVDDYMVDACSAVGAPPLNFETVTLRRGGLLGIAELVDVVPPERVPAPAQGWCNGNPWCFIIANQLLFREPIRYRGMPGIFWVPNETILDAVRSAVPASELSAFPPLPPLPMPVVQPPPKREVDAVNAQLSLLCL